MNIQFHISYYAKHLEKISYKNLTELDEAEMKAWDVLTQKIQYATAAQQYEPEQHYRKEKHDYAYICLFQLFQKQKTTL